MDFPSNSNKLTEQVSPKKVSKPEEKKIEKVVTGEVVARKKSLGRRFKDVFFGGEFKGATRYITMDVLLPAFKNMVVDATSKGVERVVYGESYSRRRSEPGRPQFSYNRPPDRRYGSRAMLPDQPPHVARRRGPDVNELILKSKEDAESVVEGLIDIIDKYGMASVSDLYELVDLPSTYIDNKWGWTVLNYVDIRQVRDGWVIDLPSVEPI